MVGVDMTLVQYKGSPAAVTAVVTGEVSVGFGLVPVALPYVAAGRLRAHAITSAKRFSGLPQVPTSAEAGLPGFETDFWLGMFVPVRTPKELVARLNRDVVSVLQTPNMQSFMLAQGAETAAGTPEEFAAFIRSETVRLKKVIEAAGIRMD
jgi:tripartite-type tricarboxylate transporter receptor subunit TctC